MTIDLSAAAGFMAAHARLLDRRRFERITKGAHPDTVLAALESYRIPDGGYGWGLEPDLRSTESQPGPALHAFEAMADAAPATTPRAVELCDWLASVTLPDGGLPFALPVTNPAGTAPFWADADPTISSLQITAIVAENAHRLAGHDPAVAGHAWLERATRYCFAVAETLDAARNPMALAFAVRFLDVAHDAYPEAGPLLERLGAHIPASGVMPVVGGIEGEAMRPLDFAPVPDGPARELLSPDVVAADLERLAGEQQDDGGWHVDFQSYSPAAALEWRGYITVHAVSILRRNRL